MQAVFKQFALGKMARWEFENFILPFDHIRGVQRDCPAPWNENQADNDYEPWRVKTGQWLVNNILPENIYAYALQFLSRDDREDTPVNRAILMNPWGI